jgi:hypothetical protein
MKKTIPYPAFAMRQDRGLFSSFMLKQHKMFNLYRAARAATNNQIVEQYYDRCQE